MKNNTAFLVFMSAALPCFCQNDSLTVFFTGNIKGERFQVYLHHERILSFKGSGSYMYSFKIPNRPIEWEKRGYIAELNVYRRGFLGFKFKDTNLTTGYEPKKYLVIWRNPLLKNKAAIQSRWTDKEPVPYPDI
jgi:hypothetical protein